MKPHLHSRPPVYRSLPPAAYRGASGANFNPYFKGGSDK